MRSAESPMACAISRGSPDSGGTASVVRASAMPTSEVDGVRRSCEIAASSELRRRSDSIWKVVRWATST
jgi:hypothetical protein